VLEDPREALPSYDTLIILSPERANDEKLIAALDKRSEWRAALHRRTGRPHLFSIAT